MNDKENAISIREHDKTFSVKKVGLFVDNGDGTLVRQTKIATSDNQTNGLQKTQVLNYDGFNLPNYDYTLLSYTGTNLTGVVFKTGGSGGTTVATLTLAYDGSSNLISVTKT